jgi:hypothetical protein
MPGPVVVFSRKLRLPAGLWTGTVCHSCNAAPSMGDTTAALAGVNRSGCDNAEPLGCDTNKPAPARRSLALIASLLPFDTGILFACQAERSDVCVFALLAGLVALKFARAPHAHHVLSKERD